MGLHPQDEDGRVAVERLRDALGGTTDGPVTLGGIAAEGIVQTDGPVTTVTFATPDRVILATAPTREAAVSLATAASEALGP